MAHIPVTRAPALPRAAQPVHDEMITPYRLLAHHARTRGDEVAYVVRVHGRSLSRTWAEVAETVERAGAGLIRSGLRADQVVISLLPAAHACPELDLALRIIGAVVVNVAPDASPDDLSRLLRGVDARLIVVESEDDLDRLRGLNFSRAELFALDGGRGWQTLLALGAERLVMDPSAMERVDQVVDPGSAVPRFLEPRTGLTRLAPLDPEAVPLRAGQVAITVGHHSDPLVQLVHEVHLATGATLCLVADAAGLFEALDDVSPSVLALSARTRAAVTSRVRRLVTDTGALVVAPTAARVTVADLPEPPPVIMGDPSLLPRRSRGVPGREFQFDTEREDEPDEPEASAFKLPSLPLFGGESVLDQLLREQARAGTR